MHAVLRSFVLRRTVVCLLLATVALCAVGRSASAQKPSGTKLGNSLDIVPADASFYSAGFRLKQQIEAIAGSKAWSTLKNMGSVQLGLGMLKGQLAQPGGPLDEYEKLMLEEENVELRDLLLDMASTEIFFYGDRQFAPTMGTVMGAINNMQYSGMFAGIAAAANGQQPPQGPEVQLAAFLHGLNDDLQNVVIPNTLIGFKIVDPAKAEKQLARLEVLLTRVLADAPPLLQRFEKTKIGNAPFLVLNVDGDLPPWDEIPWEDLEATPGEFDQLKNKLRQLKLNVSIGIKDGYILLSIGNSNEYLTSLGKGPLLVDSNEFAKLKPYLAKPLTSIAYMTAGMRIAGGAVTKNDVDEMAASAEELLGQLNLDEDLKTRLSGDVKKFAVDIKTMIPEVGPMLAFGFLNGPAIEGYVYDWSENFRHDGSKPLSLLNRVGGDPLAAFVGRGQVRPQDYDLFVKYAKIAYGYFEDFALPQIPADEADKVRKVLDRVMPLWGKLDGIVRDLLMPALKDGQSAFVMDAKIGSKQWVGPQPPATDELPMFEFALLVGVSDPVKMKQAFVELKEVVDEAVEIAKENSEGEVPEDFKVPNPRTRKLGDGEVWWYDFPKEITRELQLDPKLLPHLGLTKDVGVIGTSPRLTAKAFNNTPFVANEFLAPALAKPLAGLTHVDIAGIMGKFNPWIDYGFMLAMNEVEGQQKAMMSFAQNDVKTVITVLSCMKSYSSYTYFEDKAMVSHNKFVFEDLK